MKFRVWDKKEKWMHYSCIDDCVKWGSNPMYFFVIGQLGELQKFSVPIVVGADNRVESAIHHQIPIIDNLVVNRYIGVKGKDKKDIYESDLVRYIGSDIIWQVCYDRWGIPALARVDHPMGTDFKEMEIHHNLTPSKCEVIGNVYESPELLKENQ